MTTTQLTLSVSLRDDATFANYYSLENMAVTEQLMDMARGQGEQGLYLWGAPATGKSHLLQAACHCAEQSGLMSCYLPLGDADFLDTQMCEELEQMHIICLDDIDAIAGTHDWEEDLFHLFNLDS